MFRVALVLLALGLIHPRSRPIVWGTLVAVAQAVVGVLTVIFAVGLGGSRSN